MMGLILELCEREQSGMPFRVNNDFQVYGLIIQIDGE